MMARSRGTLPLPFSAQVCFTKAVAISFSPGFLSEGKSKAHHLKLAVNALFILVVSGSSDS